MKNITERVYKEALYLIENKSTLRKVAKVFGVSKSTVHNDFVNRLEKLNYKLFQDVSLLLKQNYNMKHIRGGEATKKKYQNKKQSYN